MQCTKLRYPVGFSVAEPGVCSHIIIYILATYADSIVVCMVFSLAFHIAAYD